MERGKRIRNVESLEDINSIIEIAKKVTAVVDATKEKINYTNNTRNFSYVKHGKRYFSITTRYVKDYETEDGVEYRLTNDKYVCTWKFDMSGQESVKVNPSSAWRIGCGYHKPYDIVKECPELFSMVDGRIAESASPLLYWNPKYDMTEHECWIYDLNSAYAAVLNDKIVDTYNMLGPGIVGKDEVGFEFESKITLYTSGWHTFRFKLIDSPYKDFVRKYYNIKRTAPKGSKEREMAKQILNLFVGVLQRHNPFLRAYIVEMCNIRINSYIKKYNEFICMANTDAVYSVVPLEDIEIGEEIGQFKLEWSGKNFRQKGMNYQKDGKVSYRGVSKCLFKEGWNLLTDPLPEYIYPYYFNEDKIIVEEDYRYEEQD